MKKILLILLGLVLSFSCYAQDTDDDKSKSVALEFLSNSGSLMRKEFIELGKIKGVKCQVLIITNVVTNKKVGCLRLETQYYSSASRSSDSYIGTLDYDEIDACIKSVKYIRDELLSTTPANYTEVEYKTNDNLKIGAFFSEDKSKWSAYVQTKGHTTRSLEFFNPENLTPFIEMFEKAKTTIAENIK